MAKKGTRDPETAHPRPKYSTPEERIAGRSRPNGDCIEWTGARNGNSEHGYFTVESAGKKQNIYVHRFVWESANGPIPAGMMIDHACRNAWCIKLEHLRLANKSQNSTNIHGPRKTNTTGFLNVQWNKQAGKYQVVMKKDGRIRHGGFFVNVEEAAMRAQQMREELFGPFAGEY